VLDILIALAAAAAAPAQAPDPSYGAELPDGAANLDFIAVNRTGRTITVLTITPSDEDSQWSEDVLVPDDLPDGERGAASYTRDVELCRWDLRATYEGGRTQVWRRIDLCATTRVVLR